MKKLLILLLLFVSAGNLNAKGNYNEKTLVFYSTPMTPDIDQTIYHNTVVMLGFYLLENIAKGCSVFAINKDILSYLDTMANLDTIEKLPEGASLNKLMIQATMIRLKRDLLEHFAETGLLLRVM